MIFFFVGAQLGTFLGLGLIFIFDGQYRLGAAQLLLAVVQAIIYTGKMQ